MASLAVGLRILSQVLLSQLHGVVAQMLPLSLPCRCLESSDFQPNLAKKYIDQRFVMEVWKLLLQQLLIFATSNHRWQKLISLDKIEIATGSI